MPKAKQTGETSKNSAASEIDDIFATKTIASSTKPEKEAALSKAAKKKAKKKAKMAEEEVQKEAGDGDEEEQEDQSDEEPEQQKVEEVVFAELAAVKKSNKRPAPHKTNDDGDDGFADSRGKKSKRMTEDGYPIFDVKELRIGEGGDTPDCPFDCQCCF
ncbi:uncharacterized protein BYT42DRAFT_588046 [Radiomyces spectabilis]|uniref:uncharacterized protein n=1 Tax=Radiomyces spectabilis TaxID=64574 RepID=UPI00221F5F2E|nr:uncharacterized protein BYT42DRAFT_588046 [Radiomyces spectabilis]KAI8366837.1 hypothetical protein BYT42DRAFT_588046 [Radiomyces spectabilis]